MFLKQYRGEGWPLVGDFAVGLVSQSPTDWRIEHNRTDTMADLGVRTPWGGLYAWVRYW